MLLLHVEKSMGKNLGNFKYQIQSLRDIYPYYHAQKIISERGIQRMRKERLSKN